MVLWPNCKDPALTFLKGQGYNVVQLPKPDLRPTQLAVRKGRLLHRLGDIESVFTPGAAPIPAVTSDNPSPTISGTKSADLDIGVGINILGGLISALGGSTLALTIGYQRARSVGFEFADVLENSIQRSQLDTFLADATVNPLARAVREMMEADDVYVITSTVKSAKLAVVAKDSSSSALAVDVPTLQAAIGGDIEVKGAGATSTFVTYQGPVPLIFGIQAVRLIFDNGRYRTMKIADAGSVALESVAPQDDPVYLANESAVRVDL